MYLVNIIRLVTKVDWRRKLNQLVIGILAMSYLGLPQIAYGANLTSASLTMSDPRPVTSSTHTFAWTEATDATLRCITYKYVTTALGPTVPTSLVTTTAVKGTFTGITAASWTLDASVNGTIKITNASGEQPGGSSALTPVTTPFTTITNPVAGTFFVQINTYTNTDCVTGPVDSDVIASVATAGTLISATINPTLTFTVAGLGNGATIKGAIATENGGGNLNCATSTATAVSFPANMSVNTNYTCGQSLTTSTNAASGYSVTLRGTHTSGDFMKGTPNTLTITDGTGTNASPAAFGTPSESFAYTSSDGTLSSGTTTRFAADDTFAKVGNNSATTEEVAYDSVPVNAQTINIGYRIRFSGTTEANTYTGTVLYTCVATF